MIRNSFCLLERISQKKEESLWKQGIKDWNCFLKTEKIKGISPQTKEYYNRRIKEAQQALLDDDSAYFTAKLPAKENWRLYGYFRDETGFLDIEVDSSGKLIMIGISNYFNSNAFVRGFNLEKRLIAKELEKYKLIVTFNGSAFDLPKLKKQLGIEMKVSHIDLKSLCLNLGLKGGLKEVEKKLDLKRPAHLRGNPVELWKAFHASGDREYLDLLIGYNKEDIENLKGVMDFGYGKKSGKLKEKFNL